MLDVPTVVLDTNVLVAASRSRFGASVKLVSLLGTGHFDICVSVPLVLEYEDVLLRDVNRGSKKRRILNDILDYICAVSKRQDVFFLWRPYLRDPSDDMILEVAVAGGCDAIITYNKRHFAELAKFGIGVLDPKEFLKELGVFR